VKINIGFACWLFVAIPYVSAQTAQLTLTEKVVTAGQPVTMDLTLDQPAACDTPLYVEFTAQPPVSFSFTLSENVTKGQTVVEIKKPTYLDAPGAVYRTTRAYLGNCPGFSQIKLVKIPERILNLRAFVDTTAYPTVADLTLKPTDHQFFDTKIVELNNLDGQVLAKLNNSAADVPDLRRFLIQTVLAADAALTVTERQYRLQIMNSSSDSSPGFFKDFHREYEGLLVDLRAPIPGTKAQASAAPVLLYVQLKKRNPSDQQRGRGTYPPAATAVRKTIADNAAVYKYVSTTGRISFDARFSSVPTGATVKYKKVIEDDYKDYSAPTDVPKVTPELAAWQFLFHMDGCTDQPRRIDPWNDTTPDISVEFGRCATKR